MTTKIPEGYRADANGNLIPDANIREIDKERDALVVALINQAKEHSGNLAIFKEAAQDAVQKFVAKSASKFRVKLGGRKHNVTLLSFDGRFKVISANSDLLVFDERLAAAKELVYKCVTSWSDGANSNMLAVINKAFDLDSDGNANAKRILGLKTLKIDDPQWQRAMEAVGQAVNVVGSKNYLRFYERTDSGDYKPIPLNITTE
jgi:hypothetical protein